ncbi:hypothetical protein A9Q74_10960 [Colwellia sp. 39_35_sub15_T18]|nr:hypothetical protein A9Q74_10960 [Colwellia sp. 39_35_sub15_T18]
MFKTNNNASTTNLSSLKKLLLVCTVCLLAFTDLITNELAANELTANEIAASKLTSKQYSVSQGMTKKDLNEQQRQIIIEANKQTEVPDQLNGKATTKTRVVMLASQNKIIKSAKNASAVQRDSQLSLRQLTLNRDYYADFTIYNAASFLLNDYDGDGFYQTFSVTFDADIYSDNQFGEVYALLYISKNGGPWSHYFTTDSFIIEGDTDLDEYEVITTFLSGYASDHYDVLIDLYQVGYSDVVATYSSDDSNALYALPLESADYDEPYVEVVTVSEGGSMSMLILFLLGTLLIRFKSRMLQAQ